MSSTPHSVLTRTTPNLFAGAPLLAFTHLFAIHLSLLTFGLQTNITGYNGRRNFSATQSRRPPSRVEGDTVLLGPEEDQVSVTEHILVSPD